MDKEFCPLFTARWNSGKVTWLLLPIQERTWLRGVELVAAPTASISSVAANPPLKGFSTYSSSPPMWGLSICLSIFLLDYAQITTPTCVWAAEEPAVPCAVWLAHKAELEEVLGTPLLLPDLWKIYINIYFLFSKHKTSFLQWTLPWLIRFYLK